MKSIKKFKLFISAIIVLVSVDAVAKDFVYDGITYTVIDEDARTCQTKEGRSGGYGAENKVTGNIILPEHPMDGSTEYTLTVISKYSFCRLDDLTGISLPNSVTKIEDCAFQGCHNLMELKLSDSLESIGVLAFGACYNLKEICLPNSVTTLGKDCFGSCNSVEKLVIPESIKEISYGAFNSCNGLQTVEMPASVTKICGRAFANCISLTDISMSGVEIIEENVFEGCTALTELTLPDNITTISRNTFKDCTSLTNIDLPKYLNSIESGAFKGCVKLTDIYLPDFLKTIGRNSFWGCNALTKISIPKSVTTIEPDAFRLCSNLQELVIEDGETNLLLPYSSVDTQELNYSFADTSLQKVYIGRNLEITQPSYGTSPFFYCRTIKKVQFGYNVNSVPDYLFWASESLEDIELSESIKRIGRQSFDGCVSLKKINLPPFLETIDVYAFTRIKLEHIFYNTSIPADLKYDAFDQWIYDNTVLEMPKSILDDIDSFSSWNNFKNKLPIAILVTSLELIPTELVLHVRETIQIDAVVMPEDATDKTIIWKSENESVATVDENGNVTAVSLGEAVITASCGENKSECKVTVVATPVDSIELSQETAQLKVGESVRLTATVLPEDATDKTVVWKSENESVATVDENGNVAAVSLGEAVITASCGEVKSECKVTVVATPVDSIELSQETAQLKVGESVQLTATALPEDATDKTVVWKSENESVATVDENGNVTAISLGEAVITASCGEVKSECKVTVVATPVESIELSQETAQLKVGESVQITVTVLPEDATDKTVVWKSENESIAAVDDNGNVTAVSLGEAIITASCGEVHASCNVTVVATDPIMCTSLTLNETEAVLMIGKCIELKAFVMPEDASNKIIQWESSNPMIAEVSSDGIVTAIGIEIGEVLITARTTDGSNLETVCRVLVEPNPVLSVELSLDSWTCHVGDEISITAIAKPDDADFNEIKWSVDGMSDVVEYVFDWNADLWNRGQSTIKLRAKSTGVVTLTAYAGYPNSVSATCSITVEPIYVEDIILSQETVQLKVGESVQLTATVLPDNAIDKTVIWKSENLNVATVDDNGNVTAVSLGEATITASCGEIKSECKVTVVATPVDSIELSQETAQLKVGESVRLTATVLPEDTTDKTVVWKSENESVATVDDNGNVTAVSLGEAVITASCGEVESKCTVTVVATPVESIELSQETAQLKVGESVQLTATVLPADATDKTIVWNSGNEAVATVDENGNVTGISLGEAVITASCGEVNSECKVTVVATPVDSIELGQETAQLKVGESVQLTATVLPADATDKTVVWKSENESVATVDENGNVTAISLGEAVITASCGDVKTECKVTVVATPVESINLSQDIAQLKVGESVQLTATVLPVDATDKTVVWKSENETVATVDENGNVTAVSLGEAVIIASCGDVKAECKVTVVATPVESIELSQEAAQLKVGESVQLTATVLPADATDKTVIWNSGNEAIATVDDNGNVTAVSLGEAVITASCGEVESKCTVTVVATPVESIELSQETAQLKVGESVQLTATVLPADATDKTVVWKSENESVATVDENGNVTAVSLGEAVITASCGEVKSECKVTVVATPVESIELSQVTAQLKVGESVQLIATILPEDATDKTVVWKSKNETVATVDENGNVTAVSLGEAVITASCGNLKASCNVTVLAIPVESIELSQETAQLKVGESVQLTATVLPEDATDKIVVWKSDNEVIATVDKNGNVTAVSLGETVITASCGEVKSECKVTVVATPVESIELSQEMGQLKVGESVRLTATVLPENATDKTVIWNSGNEAVATVDENGNVTAVSLGEAVITASCGEVKSECKVTVVATAVESIELSQETAQLKVGESVQITVTVLPEDATDKTVVWKSNNEVIATVDKDGNVVGVSIGVAVITASCGNVKASCNVTVLAIPVDSIELGQETVQLKVSESVQLAATIFPDDASDKTIVWSSKDSDVATVNENGLITAVSIGETEITAVCGDASASCMVKVMPILAESLSITPETWNGEKDETFQISSVILPENTTDKALEYDSSDLNIANVNDEGLVTVIGIGSCVITVSTTDGSNLSAECVVTGVSGVEYLFGDSKGNVDVYDTHGILLKKNSTFDCLKQLTPGIYILHSGNTVKTIYLNGGL